MLPLQHFIMFYVLLIVSRWDNLIETLRLAGFKNKENIRARKQVHAANIGKETVKKYTLLYKLL